jgi:hypothetical protein
MLAREHTYIVAVEKNTGKDNKLTCDLVDENKITPIYYIIEDACFK